MRNQLGVKQLTWQQFGRLMSTLEIEPPRHSNLWNDGGKLPCNPTEMCIATYTMKMLPISCETQGFCSILRVVGNSKASKIFAYKGMLNQLNKTIVVSTELIQFL